MIKNNGRCPKCQNKTIRKNGKWYCFGCGWNSIKQHCEIAKQFKEGKK